MDAAGIENEIDAGKDEARGAPDLPTPPGAAAEAFALILDAAAPEDHLVAIGAATEPDPPSVGNADSELVSTGGGVFFDDLAAVAGSGTSFPASDGNGSGAPSRP